MLHIAAWLLLYSIPFLLRQPYDSDKPAPQAAHQAGMHLVMLSNILHLIIWIGFFYFNALFLVPRLVNRRRFRIYVLSLIGTLALLLLLTGLVFNLLVQPPHFNIRTHVLINFFVFLFMLASSTAYQLVRDKMIAEQLAKQRENENLRTELSLLRSQVSPHFMFNVLNNMVALARKQSDQLEPSLIKLSSLMRYMLYEADEERVPLEKEIEYLQSYIDLQRQRFGAKVPILVSIGEADRSYEIEPMLLIPFVENAIKHGTGYITDPRIEIELQARNEILQFSVRNRFNPSGEEEKDKTSGIGLNNVKRRLNLLYGKNHSLLITRNNDLYTVSLQINLHR